MTHLWKFKVPTQFEASVYELLLDPAKILGEYAQDASLLGTP